MKKKVLIFTMILVGLCSVSFAQKDSSNMSGLEKVNSFLDKAGVWTMITTDGNQPKGRPFGFHLLKDGKIYFVTGTFKNVYQQMQDNPNVEVFAYNKGQFMRYDGQAVFVEDKELEQQVLEHSVSLKNIYNDKTGYKMAIFYLKNAHVEIRTTNNVLEDFDLK